MKRHPAIAIIELSDIASGMFVTDKMVKRSPISLLKSGIISQGRYLVMIGGSTAAVDEAYDEGSFWGKDSIIDRVTLPDIHPQLHDAVLGERNTGNAGAMAIIETSTVSCNVRAAELALKATPINLVEISIAASPLAGKGVSVFRGELHDIEAAVDIAVSFLRQAGMVFSYRIIPAPHDGFVQQVESGLYFRDNGALDMKGEEG